MSISEPMTLITDYLLGGVSAWLSFLLSRNPQASRRWWAVAFAALGLGAFLGGTWHGFVQNPYLWKATLLAVGVASFAMVVATAIATTSGIPRNALLGFAGTKLGVFVAWMQVRDDFLFVVVDTGIAFAMIAALHLWRFNGWILAGVAVSVAAGAVQASGLALHPHFNHNDLYHVIQIAAMVLLYRGARALQDTRRRS